MRERRGNERKEGRESDKERDSNKRDTRRLS